MTALLLAVAAIATVAWVLRRMVAYHRDGIAVAALPPLPRTPLGARMQVHRDGVKWIEAPVPARLHHCFPQSGGWHYQLLDEWWERCPCGAYRLERRPWSGRNHYRKREYDFYPEVALDA